MRMRPQSIRARDTLVATILSALVLTVLAAGSAKQVRQMTQMRLKGDVRQAATQISGARRGRPFPPGPIPDFGGVDYVQVVNVHGQVVAATRRGAKMPLLSSFRPPPTDRIKTSTVCRPAIGCLQLAALRMTTAADSDVVYAAVRVPPLMSEHRLELLLLPGVLLLVLLTAIFTWFMVGRTLRPIETISAQLAEISGTDLSRRVPQPSGDDEIARLARTANETLDRLERCVEEQRRFAADASHELRTPITGLRAELESALMYPHETDLLATMRAALRGTDRLETIITDLLLLARLGTGGPQVTERIDLGHLVEVELSQRGASRLAIGADLAAGVMVDGVPMQLARVLGNLLDNAERYGGGIVDVVVCTDGTEAMLMVTDNGPGIARADRERVFQRFTRLDCARSRSAGGTGLGLAIARDIATAHGGTLRIANSPRGARFKLRLSQSPAPE
ncbi:MAG TPA: HAMP domain-containing sensor histidine kinase [Streptosporangiaceae bacterium]|nr:HAMP domain-containing sensor histidine kinase [Streptosporangiaceae bacterium]